MRNLRFPQWVHDWWNVLNREFVRFSGSRVYLFIALAGPLLSFLVMNIFWPEIHLTSHWLLWISMIARCHAR